MSEGRPSTDQQFRFNLRRSIYGWASVALVALSTASLAYWGAALKSRNADLDAVYIGGLYLSAAQGLIRLHDDQLWSVTQTLDYFRRADGGIQGKVPYPEGPMTNLVHSDRGLDLPGLHYRSIESILSIGSPIWMLSISLLIPCGLAALLAAFCLYRYVAACRGPESKPPAIFKISD